MAEVGGGAVRTQLKGIDGADPQQGAGIRAGACRRAK